MDNFFSIGELSRYQNISKQTLIYYDRIGLFRPAYVDPDNGYRYYSAGQIDYLDTILIMKKMGFSLREIREHMQHYTIDSSLAVLRRQLTVLERQIGELRLIQSRLLHRCTQMENAKACMDREAGVVEEEAEARCILCHAVDRDQAVLCRGLSEKPARLFPERRDRAAAAHPGRPVHRGLRGVSAD